MARKGWAIKYVCLKFTSLRLPFLYFLLKRYFFIPAYFISLLLWSSYVFSNNILIFIASVKSTFTVFCLRLPKSPKMHNASLVTTRLLKRNF